ncbi:MAG: sortase [Patescibacteria group bacterium]
MIRQAGVIFEKPSARPVKKSRDLKGDSGVGQALEFPLKSRLVSKHIKPHRHIKYSPQRFQKTIGNSLIIFSILGFLLTYGPILRVELGYRLARISEKETSQTPRGGFASLLGRELIGESQGVPDPQFSLIIPKIHARGKVVANVDPADYGAYMEALKVGVAHAAGTQFPGSDGTIYLFAHSTDNPLNILRYNAIFFLLRELELGDEVEVYYLGIKHRYTVSDKKIVEPTDVSYLTPTSVDGKELLILQTCWPPGTTLKRLLIFAQKKLS